MPKYKITIVKSPIIPMNLQNENFVTYDNQVTYSVRLTNGMIVSRPEEFLSGDINERIIIEEPEERPE